MRARLVAGNWKMHGSLAANQRLLESVRTGVESAPGVEAAVCVPFPYLQQAAAALGGTRVAWGAQNLSEHDAGAYTGEVSGAMLRELGCRYVIVGHSERRTLYAERDAQVAAKFAAAQRVGLVPILCVGETLAEREQGATEEVVGRQIRVVMEVAGVAALAEAVVAYEPVWAIGTGRTASPEQAEAVHAFIRDTVGAADAGRGGAASRAVRRKRQAGERAGAVRDARHRRRTDRRCIAGRRGFSRNSPRRRDGAALATLK